MVALEHLDLKQIPEAVSWALKGMAGLGPGAGPFLQEMIIRLREVGASREVQMGFLREACEAGVPEACEALRKGR
jgi:hypothetical protein